MKLSEINASHPLFNPQGELILADTGFDRLKKVTYQVYDGKIVIGNYLKLHSGHVLSTYAILNHLRKMGFVVSPQRLHSILKSLNIPQVGTGHRSSRKFLCRIGEGVQ